MISDKVFCVQEQAFRKLQDFGENVKLPKKRKGHLIKDINSKLLKVHTSLKSDTYTLTDYKVAFKNKYPEAYDIYQYEKKQKFVDERFFLYYGCNSSICHRWRGNESTSQSVGI